VTLRWRRYRAGQWVAEPRSILRPPASPATAHAAPRAYHYLALTTGHRPLFPLLPRSLSPMREQSGGCELNARSKSRRLRENFSLRFSIPFDSQRNFSAANGRVLLVSDTCIFSHISPLTKRLIVSSCCKGKLISREHVSISMTEFYSLFLFNNTNVPLLHIIL